MDPPEQLSAGAGPLGASPRLTALLRRLGATADTSALGAALTRAWGEPHRAYHGPGHLADCLRELDGAPIDAEQRDLAEAALWFHDAVYDPHAADNELRSADWARQALIGAGVPEDTAAQVGRLVLLTRHVDPPAESDRTGALVCDVDLCVLGRPPEEYDRFERLIRAEYAWVPEPVYRVERRRILLRFRLREPLYLTEHFRRRYQAPARANLERALRQLGGERPGEAPR